MLGIGSKKTFGKSNLHPNMYYHSAGKFTDANHVFRLDHLLDQNLVIEHKDL